MELNSLICFRMGQLTIADRIKQVANGKRATWHAVDTPSVELPDSGRSRRTPPWLYVDTALLANYFPTPYTLHM